MRIRVEFLCIIGYTAILFTLYLEYGVLQLCSGCENLHSATFISKQNRNIGMWVFIKGNKIKDLFLIRQESDWRWRRGRVGTQLIKAHNQVCSSAEPAL